MKVDTQLQVIRRAYLSDISPGTEATNGEGHAKTSVQRDSGALHDQRRDVADL